MNRRDRSKLQNTTGRRRSNADTDMQVWGLIRQVSNAMYRCRERELRGSGVTPMDVAVLYSLKTSKTPLIPADISRLIFREPNTVTILLKKMEKKGLIWKRKDTQRRNLVRVGLTGKGEDTLAQAMATWAVLGEITSCLSLEETIHLRSFLLKLHRKAFQALGMSEGLRESALSMLLYAPEDSSQQEKLREHIDDQPD